MLELKIGNVITSITHYNSMSKVFGHYHISEIKFLRNVTRMLLRYN